MASVLFRDGAVVFDGTNVVFTDDPASCICCGSAPPTVVTCESIGDFVLPNTVTLIVSGVTANSANINGAGGWVALGYGIDDCDDLGGWTFPDGSPIPGISIGSYQPGDTPCVPPTPARLTTPEQFCTCVNGTWLVWDIDDCYPEFDYAFCDLWNVSWNFCGADIQTHHEERASNEARFRFRSDGGVRYIYCHLIVGNDLPFGGHSRYYTNRVAGGFSVVGGVAQTAGTHTLTYDTTFPTSGPTGCTLPSTVTVVIT